MNNRLIREALISAVEKGDLNSLQSIINENPAFDIAQNLNNKGEYKYLENLLFYAMKLQQEEITIFLIDTGKFELIPTEDFATNRNVLHAAAEAKCNKVLKHLLMIKDLNITQLGLYGWNLLHWAAACGDITTVSLVLDTKKFDINCLETYFQKYETPLHVAASKGKRELIKFLIDKGANVNAITPLESHPHYHKLTPIRTAIRSKNFEAVEVFLEHNAKYFGDKTLELETQLSFSLESILDEICDVSDPNDAIKLLDEITQYFRVWTTDEPSLEDAVSRNERFKLQFGRDLNKEQIDTINKDFQLYRFEKKCIYQLRQILREDERSVWAIDSQEPNYDNYKYPSFTKSKSAFIAVRTMMHKFYPDLQPGDIAIGTYKLILDRKKQLQEKLSFVSNQTNELERLREEVAQLKKQANSETIEELKDASVSEQRYKVSNVALLKLHKERLSRQEQMKQKSVIQEEKKPGPVNATYKRKN